jgi:hypothetical protein
MQVGKKSHKKEKKVKKYWFGCPSKRPRDKYQYIAIFYFKKYEVFVSTVKFFIELVIKSL